MWKKLMSWFKPAPADVFSEESESQFITPEEAAKLNAIICSSKLEDIFSNPNISAITGDKRDGKAVLLIMVRDTSIVTRTRPSKTTPVHMHFIPVFIDSVPVIVEHGIVKLQ